MEIQLNKRRFLSSLGLTAVFNTIIALFLTQLGFGSGFSINFIFSQSIGLCMCASILAGHLFLKRPSILGHVILFVITMPLGVIAGTLIASIIAGVTFSEILEGSPALIFQILIIGILFGCVITYFFFIREKISQTQARLHEEQIKRLTLEKKTLESHLKLLQAQIEPHFLFNTLSNILSLLETDPEKGKSMLENLAKYLRSSLYITRNRRTTLGREMGLIKAYLELHKVRMGERLHYATQIPETLEHMAVPPMLLQPIVENALKHGLEPRIDGGHILIRAEARDGNYRLIVTDTGVGLTEDADAGIGLSNVRERLKALYNGKARLTLEENQPTGLKVTLDLPK